MLDTAIWKETQVLI